MSDSLNLERLRKEAKALLKECRAGQVTAIERVRAHLPRLSALDTGQFAQQIRLADIHHALARVHGYQNWAELKRHDEPLERFLAAARSGDLSAAQKEVESFPEFAEESIQGACVLGDVDAVRHHLEVDPALISAEHGGWPPIIYVCASRFHQVSPRHAAGILDCASLLLDRGVDPNTYTLADPSDPESRIPALSRAHFSFNTPVSSLLRERGAHAMSRGTFPAVQTLVPRMPLDEALCRPDLADLREEVRQRLKPFLHRMMNAAPGPKDRDKINDLSLGGLLLTDPEFRKILTELAESHVERGVDPSLAVNDEGVTLLHEFAVVKGYPAADEVLEWLLGHGADPNLPRKDGQTPFVLAVRSGSSAAAKVMRTHGADIHAVGPVDELIGACQNGDVIAAREILSRHPDVLAGMGPRDHELLVSAAAADRQADVRFMAQLGFDPGGIDANGATALHLASWHGLVDMVRMLIELRAPVNVRDATFGTSPLAWAAQASRNSQRSGDDYCKVVESLLDAGSDYAASVNRWGVGPEEISSPQVAALLRARGFSK